jgi:hypothetical protein
LLFIDEALALKVPFLVVGPKLPKLVALALRLVKPYLGLEPPKLSTEFLRLPPF